MFSKRATIILALVIVLLMSTQFIFGPFAGKKHTKYVDAETDKGKGNGSKNKPFMDLQYALDMVVDGDTLLVKAGDYSAKAQPYNEDLCGNCGEHRTGVTASYGFLAEDKGVTIIGEDAEKVRLITNAGYGFLFLNSRGSAIANVTITGGIRDGDGKATDAGIVAKFSTLTVKNCRIADNDHLIDSVVVGIGGIMVREGSCVIITGSEIFNNGWDGIALYRGGEAYISDNKISGGRGAGIGVTWDAYAVITGNEIWGYWKGIGSFGDSRVILRNNTVRDCLGWGIVAAGSSQMDACNNVVYHNGNCGMAAWGDDAGGRFSNNIVVKNGWKEQWVAPKVGIQNYGGWDNFEISYNNVWDNAAGNYGDADDLTEIDGNLSVDPKFVEAAVGDFRLFRDSPCIDTGNPAISDPDGDRSDMGVYWGAAEWR